MSKYDKLRSLTDEDIDLFNLSSKNSIGKVLHVYDGDRCRIVMGLDSIIVKFNCKLIGNNSNNSNKAKNKFIQLISDAKLDINKEYSNEELHNIYTTNDKLVKIKCSEFNSDGTLLVELFDLNSNISYNSILRNEKLSEDFNDNIDHFKFNSIPDTVF
tara:strand:+ start:95 stop:568 length:474 start_codon:yes stop_codon:yes gene_type:complete